MQGLAGLEGKTALVTGAASGVGRAAALQLAQAGVSRIVAVDLNADGLAALAAELSVPTVTVAGDVSSEAHWDEVQPHLDGLGLAALNAGVAKVKAIDKFDFAEWRKVAAVNYDGVFLGLRASLRAMKPAGVGGSIVVTGSAAAIRTDFGMSAYGSAKAATHHMVRVAAKENLKDRIRVNAVAPGGVATPIWRNSPSFVKLAEELGSEEAAFEHLGKTGTPLGKYTSPEEIAGQILYLMSDLASTITGTVLLNDGGFTL